MLVFTLSMMPLPVCGQENPPPAVGIHMAALQGNIDAIRQHIEAGSDLNERDAWGSTPLIIAAAFGRTDVARELIEAGADLDITNSDGATPLHTAAFLCRTEIVEALLAKGANKYLRDNFGNTAAEAVADPFDDVKDIYDSFRQALGPLGLQLDYERIRATRPRIAEMLRPRAEELEAVEYTPLPGDDWMVSTPAEQGLDPMLVAQLYLDATGLETLYGLLVIKNGHLIAERYFNEGAVDQLSARQSVTKSYASALVGVALDQGYLSSVDQNMIDFFPELAGQIDDPRKEEITIRDLLQMRAGYPDEEYTPPYLDTLFYSDSWRWLPHIVAIPLTSDPGTEFAYSNLTSHILAVIVARATDTDLESYGRENLFSPIDAELGAWGRDADGYNFGCFEISFTARDMAKFGLLYLNDGEYAGKQVISADWVGESLQRYSEGIKRAGWTSSELGRYFSDIGYGYQWWSASVGEHHFDYAAGHGGNLIVLLDDLDMIIVTTADPLYEYRVDAGWRFEGAIINTVGKFIKSLPTE
ncbi:MAG: serine hydrolase [Gemmatimonadales bacterium]